MNEKGIALPTAMIVLSVLVALAVAFLVLAASEPQIGYNQMAASQARAVAETGVERALWALTKFDTDPGFADPPPLDGANTNPAPAPYNGTVFMPVANLGVFKVTVADGAVANEKLITAVGFVPNQNNPTAIKKVQVRVIKFKLIDPPCAMCAGGEAPPGTDTDLRIGGNATISAADTGKNFCPGVNPKATVMSQGQTIENGSPNVTAPPGDPPPPATLPGVAQSDFAPFLLKDADMAMLKSLAKTNGTYFQGDTSLTSPPKNGVLFVDTPSGNPLTNASPSSDIPTLDIHGDWSSGFSGWIVVAGSLKISGNVKITGLVYAQNDASLQGLGTGAINGAVITTNRVDTSATNFDSVDIGQAPLSYDCMAVRTGGGALPQGWTVAAGTYVEQQGK
jgi:hypothetical protein